MAATMTPWQPVDDELSVSSYQRRTAGGYWPAALPSVWTVPSALARRLDATSGRHPGTVRRVRCGNRRRERHRWTRGRANGSGCRAVVERVDAGQMRRRAHSSRRCRCSVSRTLCKTTAQDHCAEPLCQRRCRPRASVVCSGMSRDAVDERISGEVGVAMDSEPNRTAPLTSRFELRPHGPKANDDAAGRPIAALNRARAPARSQRRNLVRDNARDSLSRSCQRTRQRLPTRSPSPATVSRRLDSSSPKPPSKIVTCKRFGSTGGLGPRGCMCVPGWFGGRRDCY